MTDTVLGQLYAINRSLGHVQGSVEAITASMNRLDVAVGDIRDEVAGLTARVASVETRRKPAQSGRAVAIRLALAAIPPVGGLAFFWPLLARWLGLSPPSGH